MTWAATAVRMGVSSPLLAEASEALPGAVETRPSGMTRGRIAVHMWRDELGDVADLDVTDVRLCIPRK